MMILRPYGAEDNQINAQAFAILEKWAKRHEEIIKEAEVLEAAVIIRTESDREVRVIMADGSTSKDILKYFKMYETVNKKRIAIKKNEW